MGRTISVAAARFVSDLHLRAERPDLTARFAAFLDDTAARRFPALFILGDLFEYWIGDDDLASPFNAQIATMLRAVSDAGVALYFIHGNRDFLIDETFAQATGLALLEPATVAEIAGTPTLLMHGDTLCTDDIAYQEFRRRVRSADWQAVFLARSLAARRTEVEALRRQSIAAIQGKAEALMDVNPQAVISALATHRCRRLIHGHTHRPARHAPMLSSGIAERWVLSDWDTQRGDALEIDATGIRRLDLSV
jgi:UDP-2,3-diacylglucosamine hydrolase